MLDDSILYEEYRLDEFRTPAILSALRHFFFYAFGWFILFASVVYGFYSGNYRKEIIILQLLLVLVGLAFAWGMLFSLRMTFNYAREFFFPFVRIYKRKILQIELLSTNNPLPYSFLGIEISSRKSGQLIHLNESIENQSIIKSWRLPKSYLKTWLLQPDAINREVFVVVGAYSGRVWDIRKSVDS